MKKTSELKGILGQIFNWNNARLSCFCNALLALFCVRTVNLREIAIAFESKAHIDSRYKRLKRFFKSFHFDKDVMAKWIFQLFFPNNKKIYLTIDRTNWFWGKAKINILTLGVAYEGIAIPLQWQLLDKAGNASAIEHQECIARFIKLFGKDRIQGILGDREFASEYLFTWCNKVNIPYYIRIKDNAEVFIKGKRHCNAIKLFQHLKCREKYAYPMSVEVYQSKLYLAGARSGKGELMVVATNQKPNNAIEIYLRRWEIECLFQSLKKRGFRFEETHLTKLDRIDRLMSLLVVGFCWAHKVGEWRAKIRPIVLNNHKQYLRPQNSYFRFGLDFIRHTIFNWEGKAKLFRKMIKLLEFNKWEEMKI